MAEARADREALELAGGEVIAVPEAIAGAGVVIEGLADAGGVVALGDLGLGEVVVADHELIVVGRREVEVGLETGGALGVAVDEVG